jgi:hypothetical protein
MSGRAELRSAGQLALFGEYKPRRRGRYRHEHSAEELFAFERTVATVFEIRPDWLAPDERLCPGCRKVIRGQARNCGRRWCDSVRPTWGRTVGEIVRAALSAYCDLYGGDGRVLSTVLTCTHKPGWWDTDRCGHAPDGSRCSGPAGCRVRPEVEERERKLFPARSRAAKKMARTEALRKLKHAGYDISNEQAKRLGILMSVVEDQQRELPHEHVVCPHTTAVEIAFTRAFFDALPRAARHHQLGRTDRYRYALAKQGRYHARQFHGYLAKLAR